MTNVKGYLQRQRKYQMDGIQETIGMLAGNFEYVKNTINEKSEKMQKVTMSDGTETTEDICAFTNNAQRIASEIEDINKKAQRIMERIAEIRKIQYAIEAVEHSEGDES